MNDPPRLEPDWDPCPSRTRTGVPCGKPKHHVGHCSPAQDKTELYRKFIADVRAIANKMTREEIESSMEYHLIYWRVLRNEYNGR